MTSSPISLLHYPIGNVIQWSPSNIWQFPLTCEQVVRVIVWVFYGLWLLVSMAKYVPCSAELKKTIRRHPKKCVQEFVKDLQVHDVLLKSHPCPFIPCAVSSFGRHILMCRHAHSRTPVEPKDQSVNGRVSDIFTQSLQHSDFHHSARHLRRSAPNLAMENELSPSP